MLMFSVRTWSTICVVLIVLGYLSSGGLDRFIMSEDEDLRSQLARQWAQKVSVSLPLGEGRPRVAVAWIARDHNGLLTTELRNWVSRQNVQLVCDDWWREPGYTFGLAAIPNSLETSAESLTACGADFIVACEIKEWATYPSHEAHLLATVSIVDTQTQNQTYREDFSLPEVDTVDAPSRKVASAVPQPDTPELLAHVHQAAVLLDGLAPNTSPVFGAWHGLVSWGLTVLLLPLGFGETLRKVLRQQSNLANLGLVILWVAVALSLAWVLWAWRLSFLPLTVSLLAAGAVATPYFGWICQQLQK